MTYHWNLRRQETLAGGKHPSIRQGSGPHGATKSKGHAARWHGPTIVVHHGGDSGVEMAGKGTQGYYVRAVRPDHFIFYIEATQFVQNGKPCEMVYAIQNGAPGWTVIPASSIEVDWFEMI